MEYFDKDFLRVCIGRIRMRFLDRKFFKRFSKSSYRKGSYGISLIDRDFFFVKFFRVFLMEIFLRFSKIRIGNRDLFF